MSMEMHKRLRYMETIANSKELSALSEQLFDSITYLDFDPLLAASGLIDSPLAYLYWHQQIDKIECTPEQSNKMNDESGNDGFPEMDTWPQSVLALLAEAAPRGPLPKEELEAWLEEQIHRLENLPKQADLIHNQIAEWVDPGQLEPGVRRIWDFLQQEHRRKDDPS